MLLLFFEDNQKYHKIFKITENEDCYLYYYIKTTLLYNTDNYCQKNTDNDCQKNTDNDCPITTIDILFHSLKLLFSLQPLW